MADETCEHAARASVDLIESGFRSIFEKAGKLSAKDKELFENRLKVFRQRFDSFAGFIEPLRTKSPKRVDGLYMLAHGMIVASIELGSAGGVSERTAKFHATLRGSAARSANSDKAKIRKQTMLRPAIMAACGGKLPKGGIDYAKSIRADVLAFAKSQLPENKRATFKDRGFSASVIQGEIYAILEEQNR